MLLPEGVSAACSVSGAGCAAGRHPAASRYLAVCGERNGDKLVFYCGRRFDCS